MAMLPMDDELWDLVWERRLDHLDRHRFARALWAGREPEDAFGVRVQAELARRWRRQCVRVAILHLLHIGFWMSIQANATTRGLTIDPPVTLFMSSVSLAVIMGCAYVRHRMGQRPLPKPGPSRWRPGLRTDGGR